VFTRAGASGTLSPSAFHQGANAADAGDRILYDAATGNIFYDGDGSGAAAALLFATVDPGTPLTHADFVIYG
jgi:Ca2+-binding RTX toxin-like protein